MYCEKAQRECVYLGQWNFMKKQSMKDSAPLEVEAAFQELLNEGLSLVESSGSQCQAEYCDLAGWAIAKTVELQINKTLGELQND